MDQQVKEISQTCPCMSSDLISNNVRPPIKLRGKLNALVEELADKDQWNISSNMHTHEEIIYLFGKTQKFGQINRLWMHWNQYPQIITILLPYTFPNLKIINLGGNNIESLEPLQKANFERLEQLWLWFNRIVRIDCLRKCNFPNLKYLDVGDNQIRQCDKLYQLQAPNIQRINLEKNKFTTVNHFVKQLALSSQLKLMFMDNKIIKVFSQPRKKRNKVINEITLTRKDQRTTIKYN